MSKERKKDRSTARSSARASGTAGRRAEPDAMPLSREQQKIAKWLKKLKFHKGLFGGVREQEVWKRMNELNAMYEVALAAERARCDALIEQARRTAADSARETSAEPYAKRREIDG